MHTFAASAPVTAVVTVPAGRIHVTAAGRQDATVEVRPADPAKARDVKLAAQVTAAYSDGVLRVTAPDRNRVLGSSGAVEVTVQLPAGSRVEAKTARRGSPPRARSAPSPSTARRAPSRWRRPPPRACRSSTATSRSGGWAATRRSAPSKATSRSPRRSAARSCCAPAGSVTVGAATGVSAALNAGTTIGRIRNTLSNASAPALTVRATTTVGDITASSL